jgi:putative phosphoribosyl transferase
MWNERSFEQLPGIRHFVMVPGASHLFTEPGALERVASLAGDWFEQYLGPRHPLWSE